MTNTEKFFILLLSFFFKIREKNTQIIPPAIQDTVNIDICSFRSVKNYIIPGEQETVIRFHIGGGRKRGSQLCKILEPINHVHNSVYYIVGSLRVV